MYILEHCEVHQGRSHACHVNPASTVLAQSWAPCLAQGMHSNHGSWSNSWVNPILGPLPYSEPPARPQPWNQGMDQQHKEVRCKLPPSSQISQNDEVTSYVKQQLKFRALDSIMWICQTGAIAAKRDPVRLQKQYFWANQESYGDDSPDFQFLPGKRQKPHTKVSFILFCCGKLWRLLSIGLWLSCDRDMHSKHPHYGSSE